MIPSGPDDRDILAGEYVLGLLDANAMRDVELALKTDEDLRDRIAFWEEGLFPLAGGLQPEVADPAIWARIERDLSALKERRAAVARPMLSALDGVAGRVWRNVALWRLTTGLAVAAAIVLALAPGRFGPRPESATRFFAIMQSRDPAGVETGPGWLIQVAMDGTVRSIPLATVEPGQGRSLQLWTLWDQARGPVSLGVLPLGGAIRLPPERLDVIGPGQLFEITLEPEHGSSTGRPTGRILFIGRASAPPIRSL